MRIENNEVGYAKLVKLLKHICTVIGFPVGIKLLTSAFVYERHNDIDSLSLALKYGQDP